MKCFVLRARVSRKGNTTFNKVDQGNLLPDLRLGACFNHCVNDGPLLQGATGERLLHHLWPLRRSV